MKCIKMTVSIGLAVLAFALCAQAQQGLCSSVIGSITWTVIPAPNDPFGRVVGTAKGSLRGPTSAIINKLTADPATGILKSDDFDVFVLGKQDAIWGNAKATFTPIPGQPGDFQDEQVITITGGAGRFTGATGTLQVLGRGYNLFPGAPLGFTYFQVDYSGQVCHPFASAPGVLKDEPEK